MANIQIDQATCSNCELCLSDCVKMVFTVEGDRVKVAREEKCIRCGHCVAICPEGSVIHRGLNPAGFEEIDKALAPGPDQVFHLLRARRSIRLYKDKPVPREALEKIIEAGRYSPTGSNSQNVEYVAVVGRQEVANFQRMTVAFYEKLFGHLMNPVKRWLITLRLPKEMVEQIKERLADMLEYKRYIQEGKDVLFYDAPALLVAHAPAWETSSAFNGAAALYSASLMAHSIGLGTCFNGFFENAINRSRPIRERLGIPEKHRAYGTMTIGYPAVRYKRLVDRDRARVRWIT